MEAMFTRDRDEMMAHCPHLLVGIASRSRWISAVSPFCWSVLALVGLSLVAVADEKVVVKGGSTLLGKASSGEKFVEVAIAPGVRVALDPAKVDLKKDSRPEEEEYLQRLAKLAETPEAHWDMYQWCKQNSLTSFAYQHAWRVIELDPNHTAARAALDFLQDGKEWVHRDVLMARRGRIKDGSQWRLPEEIEKLKAEEANTEAITKWKRDIKAWKSDVYSNGPRAAKSRAKLEAIADPMAIGPLVEQLQDGNNPVEFRGLVVGLLSKMEHPMAVQALINASVKDSNQKVREAALDVVVQKAPKEAGRAYLRLLTSANNRDVNVAARALGALNDPAYAWPLIEALVTEHKRVVKGSPNQNYGTDSNGTFTMGQGQKDQVKIESISNNEVLGALTALYPGVNYRFDEGEWKVWYLQANFPEGTDLRRDP